MPNNLKHLKITTTDLVDQGANPDARIKLFKRKGETGEPPAAPDANLIQKIAAAIAGVFGKSTPEPVAKAADTFADELAQRKLREVCSQVWDYIYALENSFCSIFWDDELTEEQKRDTMFTSLDEFAETMRGAIPQWAAGNKHELDDSTVIQKTEFQKAAFEELIQKYAKTAAPAADNGNDDPHEPDNAPDGGDAINKLYQKEETDTMKINKSKMTPEELAALEAIEKKYGIAEAEGGGEPGANNNGTGDVAKGAEPSAGEPPEAPTPPELHPEVKKALEANSAMTAKLEEMTKSLELKDLTAVAKKYELIGKNADELAGKLYELKKAGDTHYNDTIALLDEQVNLVEKSGMFGEIGTSRSGTLGTDGEIGGAVAEIRKTNADLSTPEAIIKAFEDNPELAAKYETDYFKKQ
jgi:hypothetical protein